MAPIILFIKSKFLSFAPSSPCSWPQIFPKASLCRSVPTSQAAERVTEVETRGCQSPVSLREPMEAYQKKKKCVFVCLFSCAQLSMCTCIYWGSPEQQIMKMRISVNRRETAKPAVQNVAVKGKSNRLHLQLTNFLCLVSIWSKNAVTGHNVGNCNYIVDNYKVNSTCPFKFTELKIPRQPEN